MGKEKNELVLTSVADRMEVMRFVLNDMDNERRSFRSGNVAAPVDEVLPYVHLVKANQSVLVHARIAIGYYLFKIYRLRVINFDGYDYGSYYDTFMLFCENEFGFSKTKVANLISCALKYSEYVDGEPTERLDSAYEAYSYSQLVEMLPLETLLPSSCRVKDIRAKKAELAKDEFLLEKAKALSYVAGLAPSFDDCRVIVADDLCVGDVLIITNAVRVVVTDVKKSSKQVSYVTTAHPSGYPDRYMGCIDVLYPVYLSTRSHSVQTSDVDAELVQTSDVDAELVQTSDVDAELVQMSDVDVEFVQTSDVDAELVQTSDVGAVSKKYTDYDFVGLHKPALVEMILHMAYDGWSLAMALGYARARLEKDRARVHGLSLTHVDNSEVQND